MARPKKPENRESGGKRMTDAGYKPVLLRVTPEEHELLRSAARKERRPITQFVLTYILEQARRVLGE